MSVYECSKCENNGPEHAADCPTRLGRWEVRDWANNLLFNGKTFESFYDGWAYIYETLPGEDEMYGDLYVVEAEDCLRDA